MTPTPHLQAAAMRAAAVAECTSGLNEAKEYNMPQMAMGYSACRAAILALPLEADHAALLSEAVHLPEIEALIEAVKALGRHFIPFSDDEFRAEYALKVALSALKPRK